MKARKSDVVNKNDRSCAITDTAITSDLRFSEKRKKKLRYTRN